MGVAVGRDGPERRRLVPAPRLQIRDPVRGSPDLDRVLALARRPPVDLASPRAEALVEIMTERLRRSDRPPGAPCGCAALGRRCIDRLLPAQAWALWEAPLGGGGGGGAGAGGLLAPIGVGHGKTGLDVMVATVIPNCKLAALLVPPGLVEQFVAEYLAWSEHFAVPSLVVSGTNGVADRGWIHAGRPVLHLISYARFSRAEATDLLDRLAPDLVIADEAHALRHRSAARTARVLRYFASRPETRLCAWSGTVTSRSIRDFAHLAAFALGEGSPLPLDPDEVDRWAAAVDPSEWPAPPGALRRLTAPGEGAREALRRRQVETAAFVSTTSSVAGASIVLRERRAPPVPTDVRKKIADLRASWTRPDGEEFVEALAVARCARELACGFFYRWRFPGKPDPRDVEAWFAARKAWHRELREVLRDARPHMDSPLLCAKAAIRAYADPEYSGDLPTWRAASWPAWRDLRDTVAHETEAVWVDRWLARDAAEWAAGTRGIVWYEHDAFGRAVAEEGEARGVDLPVHGGGEGAEEAIRAVDGTRSIVASIRSHGVGRDGLQLLFAEQLVANPPASGDAWEQLLGRLHRQGQAADEVVAHVYRHTVEMAEAIDRAVETAKYIEGITGNRQKLLAADVEWAPVRTGVRA